MTKFLNAERASSKASRNERKQTTKAHDSAATERAVATLRRSLGKDLKKADNQEREIAKAIADTMPDFIAAVDEDVLAPFFFSLERLATAANRRRIAKHPLRPEAVDDLHEEADKEDAQAAEEEKRAKAQSARDEVQAASAKPRGDDGASVVQ